MAFKQVKKKLLYGYCTVQEKLGDVQVILRTKDLEQSTKDSVVWKKQKFVFTSEEFFSFLPKTVKTLDDPNKKYHIVMSEDGEKIFQFRPYNDEMVVRFRGFFRNDKGDIVFNEGFKDKELLTAIFETEVSRGPWTGAVYPFRYWAVNDKKTKQPVFKVVDGDIVYEWITKPMRTILEMSGVMERAPKCPLADTDDPQLILSWLEEEILKDRSVRIMISVKDGYPDWDKAELLEQGDDDVKNTDVFEPGDDVEVENFRDQRASKFDDDDDEEYPITD